MKIQMKTFAAALAGVMSATMGAAWLNAQITNPIKAHIEHSFVIGNATLPPGEYTFRMMPQSELSIMTATNDRTNERVEFIVRETIDNHMPGHSELFFRRYGDTEFLSKVFESGSRSGVELTETSRQEARMAKQGLHAMEHSEEQR